eukprot:gnl/TRDRNA2_/TRDRNA2_159156_c0_seq1.p1 gnl/TRDRNA2_/TRDRNA2_159156_c0~~gnl/TRDRNA2_/TRDRNA2_159156_c0_seq1.p1  ORF type:complete len:134 (+),score=21.51 gnl/TRDRNA2_/TRDRNA2_159156_c0_seq1:36-404(+)
MLWHAGLRGGIALTLALEINDWAEHKAILVMATFIVITAFLIVMGSTVDFMLEALQIPRGPEHQGASLSYAELLRQCEPGDSDSYAVRPAKMFGRALHPMLVGEAALSRRARPSIYGDAQGS